MHKHQHNQQLPPEVERYLALCQRTYERMVEEGTWLWPEMPNSQDMLESKDNPENV